MREDRISKMEEYIRDKKFVSLDELCVKFDVSKNTVRRDINEIIGRSDIKKIYGGVSIQYNKVPPPFAERLAICEDLKDSIGRSAARGSRRWSAASARARSSPGRWRTRPAAP